MTEQITSTGLIKELAEYLWRNGDVKTHPDWVESLATALVGTMMGKDRYTYNKFGKLPGIIFSIIIGASGISFKTVPNGFAKILIKRVNEFLNDEICQEFGLVSYRDYKEKKQDHDISKPRRKRGGQSEEDKKRYNEWLDADERFNRIETKLEDLEAPTKFTSEGLSIFLLRHPQCFVIGDEYTKLFKGAKTKDYLADNMEDLSRLYECRVDKYATASRGTEYPEDAYVNFVSATTTYLLSLMDETFFLQGTGNRILWIFDDLEEKRMLDVDKEAMKMDFWWSVEDEQKNQKTLDELAHKLITIRRLPESPFLITLDAPASMMLDKYRLTKYNDALAKLQVDILDIDGGMISRLAENAMRLAMIHCVGRYALESYETGPQYVIDKMEINSHDAEWAIAKVERHFEHYVKLFRHTAPRLRTGQIKSYRVDKSKVFAQVDSNDQLTLAKLNNYYSWNAKDSVSLIESMITTHEIMWFYPQTKHGLIKMYGGRPVAYLRRFDEDDFEKQQKLMHDFREERDYADQVER